MKPINNISINICGFMGVAMFAVPAYIAATIGLTSGDPTNQIVAAGIAVVTTAALCVVGTVVWRASKSGCNDQ